MTAPVAPAPAGWTPQQPVGPQQPLPPQQGWGQAPTPPPPGQFGPGQPVQGPAAGWTPGVQGPKKKKKWPFVLLGIFLLMVLGIGACTALVVKAVGKPIKAGNNFAAALYKDPAAAAAMICPGASLDEASLKTTRDALISGGWTGDKRLVGANVNSNNGSTSAVVSGTFGSEAVTIEMGKNGSDYCVNSLLAPGVNAGLAIPDISIPDISIPDISIPDISIPEVSIPDLTVPAQSGDTVVFGS